MFSPELTSFLSVWCSHLDVIPPDLSPSSPQVPGKLHGGRQGRINERKSPQRYAHRHTAQEVHGAHQDYLPAGEETQAGHAPSDGGGGRAGQPAGGGRSGWSSVPRVGFFSPGLFCYVWVGEGGVDVLLCVPSPFPIHLWELCMRRCSKCL